MVAASARGWRLGRSSILGSDRDVCRCSDRRTREAGLPRSTGGRSALWPSLRLGCSSGDHRLARRPRSPGLGKCAPPIQCRDQSSETTPPSDHRQGPRALRPVPAPASCPPSPHATGRAPRRLDGRDRRDALFRRTRPETLPQRGRGPGACAVADVGPGDGSELVHGRMMLFQSISNPAACSSRPRMAFHAWPASNVS